jgi:hypothetical protein
MKRTLRVLLLASAPLLMAPQSGVPMELPNAIGWEEFVDSTRVAEAVLDALAGRKWLIEADTGQSIIARHQVRVHWLRLRIDYGPRGVSYHYLDSGNYAYEEDEGQRYIHRRANKILQRLDDEVRIQVQRVRFQREPTEVVPIEPGADPAADPPPDAAPGDAAETGGETPGPAPF